MVFWKSPEARELSYLRSIQGWADPFHTECARAAPHADARRHAFFQSECRSFPPLQREAEEATRSPPRANFVCSRRSPPAAAGAARCNKVAAVIRCSPLRLRPSPDGDATLAGVLTPDSSGSWQPLCIMLHGA